MVNIVPVTEMRDTNKFVEKCKNSKDPIFITKNGYGRLVVMDIECFERLMNQAYEAKIINKGLADLDEGKVKTGKEVLDEMRQKYGF